jgi:chromosomal replication initiation ATPase DnaA
LRNRLGREPFEAWLRELECERIDGAELIVSLPTRFTKRWIDQNFPEELRECPAIEFPGIVQVKVVMRAAVPIQNV